MRVLIVHNRYRSAHPSGENAVVDDESRLLGEHGVVVERLEIEGWGAARRAALPARVVWSGRGYGLVRAAIERFDPDVVHMHNTFPLLSPSALWAARRSRAAVVQTLHNFRALCPAATFMRDGKVCEDCLGKLPLPGLRHGCYRGSRAATAPLVAMTGVHRLLATWARCVDRYIVPSHFARSAYVRAGWPEERLEVKFNTVVEPGLRRAGAGDGFVCVSRLSTEKGVDLLLRAWAEAFPRGGARLTVVGTGDDEAALRRRAAGLEGVEFVGQFDHAATLRTMSGARAVIVPSRCFEVFPRTVVEAYALGVPVVASRLGSLVEIVEDGKTGVLFDHASPRELAEALRMLAASDEHSRELGSCARIAYETKLHPARVTEQLLACYGRAVEAKAARTSANRQEVANAGVA